MNEVNARYWVSGADGQTYGPLDLAGLQQCVHQATVKADTLLCLDNDPNQQWFAANTLPGLVFSTYGYTPPNPVMLPSGPEIYGGLPQRIPFGWADAGARGQHQLSRFEVALVILLNFFTLGLFNLIWFGIQHGNLPKIARDDPSAGKAIGFSFIPFFNFYWQFIFWMRLCDRINLQLVLRGRVARVPKGLAQARCILSLIPYAGIISWLILDPILMGKIQSAINELAAEQHR